MRRARERLLADLALPLGCTVTSNLNLTFGYKSTIGDSAPSDLRMDGFMVTLVYGGHPLIEGSKRLKSGEKQRVALPARPAATRRPRREKRRRRGDNRRRAGSAPPGLAKTG